ncbi:MAG TPA: SDR family NAD(P)-dependent oxidoreductase, partial [Gemmatimonadetes bacterium]|nr:SDR family NAD(P)-dependent oxidoreductase [Gemmatimonadota bacterium]
MSQGDELAGRTALVTGASRGIGRSVAESLARAGAHVWCLARSTEAVRGLATQIGGEPLVVDLADDAAVWDGLDTLCDQLGHAPDIVVNAAGEPDYNDSSITANGRVGYSLDFVPTAKASGITGIPENITFLTADGYGVLPPVARLSVEGAMFHFACGFTSKMPGTEEGVTEPKPT